MPADRTPVLMIGCGRMGGAIAKALLPSRRVMAFDPKADLPDGVERRDTLAPASLPEALTIMLAVKPQMAAALAGDLAKLSGPGRLFVSIMAGLSLKTLEGMIGENAAIVRAMPNTPAAIGHGVTAAIALPHASDAQRQTVADVFRATGELVWVQEETDLDAVTAVSGSGPAYFFRFAEALILAGMAEGLSEDLARTLVRQTFAGAARLAQIEPATPLSALRVNVTSPGGTTAAGLEAMERAGIDVLAQRTVQAAAQRSRDLARSN